MTGRLQTSGSGSRLRRLIPLSPHLMTEGLELPIAAVILHHRCRVPRPRIALSLCFSTLT